MAQFHSKTAENPLPTPAERPAADVVVYDGHCNFCRAQVERLRWWDCQGRLAYQSMHDPAVAKQWPDLSAERLHAEMCVVDRQGNRHWGPYAFRYLTRRLRRLWWAAPLMHLPGIMLLAKPVYRWVSRNRYLIAGKTECDSGACELPRR
ncbi:MAG: DUF393 domain-containing protein [Planctomycetales bacterium]|nr:DUF393 domain-containing protein [Planctomycetales bacterium]